MKRKILNPYFLVPFVVLLALTMVWLLSTPKGTFVLLVNDHHTDFLDTTMPYITHLGTGWVFGSVVLILLLVRYQYAVTGAIVLILVGVTSQVLKRLVFADALRPKGFFEASIVDLNFVEGVKVSRHFSFPSGHTMTIFALCAFLSILLYRRHWGIVLLMVAVVTGFSRIYLLQHFLVDTFWGSIIGVCIALGTWKFLERTQWFHSKTLGKSLLNRRGS